MGYYSAGVIKIKKGDFRNVIALCALFFVLIVGRGMNNTFFYLFAGVASVAFLFSSGMTCFLCLLFLLPFAAMLKMAPGQISFFTILFLLTVAKLIYSKKIFHTHVVLSVLLFLAYGIIFSGFSEVITVMTMACGLIMLYCIRAGECDAEKAVTLFAVGICGASILSLLAGFFPYVQLFMNESMLKLGKGEYMSRFSGLYGNPNYYTMDITVALAGLIVIMFRRKSKRLLLALFIALSLFGIMSLSKSFLLSWIVLVFAWFILSMRQGMKKFAINLILIALIAAGAFLFAYDYISAIMMRFVWDQGATLNDITTGRSNTWIVYLNAFFSDIKVMLVGKGLLRIIEERAAHNTFIEYLYYLGITGTIIWWNALRNCIGKVITTPIMWVPVGILMFRMMAIGISTYENLFFYLALIVVMAKSENQNRLAVQANGEA